MGHGATSDDHQNVGTVATDSYRRILDHNPQPKIVGCDRNHDGPDRLCAINNTTTPVVDQMKAIEVQLLSTIKRPTLPVSC